jgi:hypothetical protein
MQLCALSNQRMEEAKTEAEIEAEHEEAVRKFRERYGE